jgi:arylsulfatase A-like enzyme
MPIRPNILLLHVDQHRYDCVGGNGHPVLQTPALDRLAAEGARFTHAFTPCPVCVPARVSQLCGQWAVEHRVIANADTEVRATLPENLPLYPRLLADAGYWLGHVGKWGGPVGPREAGYATTNPGGSYLGWRNEHGLPAEGSVWATRGKLLFDGPDWFGAVDPDVRPEETHLAWQADQVIGLLEARAGADEPFCLRWDADEPHLPNVVPEPYASMYPLEAIAPWPSFPDPLVGKPYMQRQQRRSWGIDGWTWAQWRPVVQRYLGELSLIDRQVGRILAALDRLGLAENTLVVYSTDHGDLCGGHGMVDKHYVMYDDVTRVPLFLRWPGRIAPGQIIDEFICHQVDLATTFLAAAGLPAPDTFRGVDLLPVACDGASTGREDIFASYHGNQFGLYSQRMVRDRRWKYVWNATAEDELYDLARDPGELVNLAGSPACREELARLRLRLQAWAHDTHDALFYPGGHPNPWLRAQLERGWKV